VEDNRLGKLIGCVVLVLGVGVPIGLVLVLGVGVPIGLNVWQFFHGGFFFD
jgi:hypothetical protein